MIYDTAKLKQMRIQKLYSIYDMAKKLNITPAYYSMLENKKRRLYYEMAVKIAMIFDTTPDKIFVDKF